MHMQDIINPMETKRSPVLKWVLVLSIMVVANLFINYAINTAYHTPKYEDYCPMMTQPVQDYSTQSSCLAVGGQWNAQVSPDSKMNGYCNADFTCRKGYDTAQQTYDRNVFVVRVAIGLLLLSLGFFLRLSETFSLSFSFAGFLSLVVGSVAFWGNMQDYIRVIVLGLALAFLVWLAIKKIKM